LTVAVSDNSKEVSLQLVMLGNPWIPVS